MRRRQAELLGVGHPLVDALLAELQRDEIPGAVTILDSGDAVGRTVQVHCIAHTSYEDGQARRFLRTADLRPDGAWAFVEDREKRSLMDLLHAHSESLSKVGKSKPTGNWAAVYRQVVSFWESELRTQEDGVWTVRIVVTGVAGVVG